MESDSENDEDIQIEDLQRLTAVIQADDALMSESSQCSSYSVSMGSTSTKVRDSYSKIESSLALNKLIEEKLVRLERIMCNRLRECRRRLEQFQQGQPTNEKPEGGQPYFRYVHCGRPYFRDKQNFPAPENEDTILMTKSGMYDLSMVSSVPGWTVKDKSQFLSVLLQMSRAIRTKELESKMAQLKRDSKVAKAENLGDSLKTLQKEIKSLKKKSLEEIALELEQEYDWDAVAHKLNRRHTAQEYQALWKLFLHPSINKTPWFREEHLELKRVASLNNFQNWDKIAQDLNTGRTGYQCFVYYRTNTSNTITGQKWTKEEEEYLKRLIEFYREEDYIPWGKVAASMENRTKIQVYNKYSTMIVKRKGRFLPEEDSVILTCVEKYGENFSKIAAYLPGRSAKQLQVRYGILRNRATVSVVWTPEEDKKLVQIVANSDTIVNYSSIAKFFPGKDRFHIRARYMTLEKWLKRHPYDDIADAPRRAARRLAHGQSTSDINKAVQSLKSRMQTEVFSKRKSKITSESTEKEIEDSIIAVLVNESHKEEARKKQELEDELAPEDTKPMSTENMNEANMHRVLIMLKAKLNKEIFEQSWFGEKYPGLTLCSLPNKNSYKSYSKKVQGEKSTTPDIWGKNPLSFTQYFFPPNYDSITGCRKLMKHVRNIMNKVDVPCPTFSLLEKHNCLIREQKRQLMVRFSTLFVWPMLLSSVGPNVNPLKPLASPKKQYPMITPKEPHSWVRPPVREKIEVNDNINLEEESVPEKIAISTIYVGNDDFMYLPTD